MCRHQILKAPGAVKLGRKILIIKAGMVKRKTSFLKRRKLRKPLGTLE